MSYLTGGQAIAISMVLPVGAGSILAFRAALLPRWTGWLGLAAVVVSVASATTLLGPMNNRSPLYGFLLLAAILGFAWVLVASIVLARQHSPGA
jgi:hypothetical protein